MDPLSASNTEYIGSLFSTDATGGKLTDEETEIVRQWIVAGAPLPTADTPDDAAGLK